jgi:hypothetical protein
MWDTHIHSLRFAINSAAHETTGVNPAELIFGQNIASPMENTLREQENFRGDFDCNQYLSKLREKLAIIRENIVPTV